MRFQASRWQMYDSKPKRKRDERADGRFPVTAEPGETMESAATLAVTLTPDNLSRRGKLTVRVESPIMPAAG